MNEEKEIRWRCRYDDIREMTAHQMAMFLACRASCDLCKLPCKAQEHGSLANCVAHHYDWLKEES